MSPNTSLHAIAAAMLALIISACGTTPRYVGLWEQGDRQSHAHLFLSADGTCVFAVGNEIDAVGGCCRYAAADHRIRLTEFEDTDGFVAIPADKSPAFTYSPDADMLTLTGPERETMFHRDRTNSTGMTERTVADHCGKATGPAAQLNR